LVLISRRSDTSRSSPYCLSQIYFLSGRPSIQPFIPVAKATNSEAVILLFEIMSVPYCQEHADCQVEAEAGLLGKDGCAGQVGGMTAVPQIADDFLQR
jgi:hypothetical protein